MRSIGGLLSPVVQWTESNAFQFSYRTSDINITDLTRGIRNRAVNLIKLGLHSADTKIKVTAFEIADEIGRYRTGSGYDKDSEIAMIIDAEKITIIDSMNELYHEDTNYWVVRRIEDRLWNWWCFSSDNVADKCEEVLRKIKYDPSYSVTKILYSGDLPFNIQIPTKEELKNTDRSGYFFSEKREERDSNEETFVNLINDIGIDDTAEEWVTYIRKLTDGDIDVLSWRGCQFFHYLAKRMPNTGWKLVFSEDSLWTNCKQNILVALKQIDNKRWVKELNSIFSTHEIDTKEASYWLAVLDWRDGLPEQQWGIVDKALSTNDSHIMRLIVDNLTHTDSQDWERASKYIYDIVCNNTSDENNLDDLYSRLVHNRPDDLKDKLSEIDELALEYLLRDDLNEYIPWDRPYWVSQFFVLVSRIDPDRFFKFIEDSLSTESRIRKMRLQVLGARNANDAFSKLLSGSERIVFIRNLIQWAANDSLLGEFAGSVLSRQVAIEDTDFKNEISKYYLGNDYEGIARVLGRYTVSSEWLDQLKELLVVASTLTSKSWDTILSLVSHSYWSGTIKRTPGNGAPRDTICREKCNLFANDQKLPKKVRNYFEEQRKTAENNIERDIASDEIIAGESLR